MFRIFRALMQTLADPSGIPVVLRWLNRPLWKGHLSRQLPLACIANLLTIAVFTLSTSQPYNQFRFINFGKYRPNECLVGDFDVSPKYQATVFNLIRGMSGGGPGGVKTGMRLHIKNSIAGTLLQEGYALPWVSETLERVIEGDRVKMYGPIAEMPPGPNRLKQLLVLLTQHGCDIPKQPNKHASMAKHQHKAKRQTVVAPDPSCYHVLEGYLFNEDGTEAKPINTLTASTTGFMFATPAQAVPWLESNPIAKDELALVVIGELTQQTSLAHSKQTIPCCDNQGRTVLMSCTLVQLGEKSIATKKFTNPVVPEHKVAIISITLWKEDWEGQWDQVATNPGSVIRQQFGDSLLALWGKSYRKGKQPSSPMACTSIQFHATVQESDLPAVLAHSGCKGLWLVPKNTQGQISGDWKLIWLPAQTDADQAKVSMIKVPHAAGLIRIKGRYAIRVPVNAYAQSWKLLFPSLDVPQLVDTSHTYKIDHLPYGVTSEAILKWAQSVQWTVKPLRPVGPRGWIVGAPSGPPVQQLAYNGMPLLIREITPTTASVTSPIVAGPRPRVPTMTPPSGVDPLVVNDPWAKPWANWKATPSANALPPIPMQVSRSIPGPIETTFQAQEERLKQLESEMASIATQQQQQGEQLTQCKAEIQKSEQSQQQYIDKRFQEFRHDLEGSFSQALMQQSKGLDSTLQEMKQLILAQNAAKRKSPQDGDDDMGSG